MGSIIRRIKLQNIDEGTKILYRTRRLSLKLKESNNSYTFETPLRAYNQQELKAKATVPTEIPLKSAMGVADFRVNKDTLNKFLTENTTASNKLRNLSRLNTIFSHFPLRTFLMQPTTSGSSGMTYITSNSTLTKQFLRLIAQFTIEAGFNTLTIPYLALPVSKIERIYEDFSNYSIQNNLELIPTLDLSSDNRRLENLLRIIKEKFVETDQLKLLGLIYRPYHNCPVSYDLIWNYINNLDIGVVLFGVDRYLTNMSEISGPHFKSFVLGDIFSLKVVGYFGGGKDKPVESKIRFFCRNDLEVKRLLRITQNSNQFKNILDELEEVYSKDYKNVKKAIINFKEAQNDDDKFKSLSAITKVHESVMSNKEFNNLSVYVKNNETKDYLYEKPILKKSLVKISQHKLK